MFLEQKIDALTVKIEALLTHLALGKDSPAGKVEQSKPVETKAADKVKPVETAVEPKTEKKPETETIDAKVARLAKELLNKSRPKLIAALKELGVERARDLKPDQLAKAAEAFEKAVKEA